MPSLTKSSSLHTLPEDDQTTLERAVVKKLDYRLLPFLSFLYLLSYLDRSNISNVHDPLLEDLGLSESQYSMAVGVFYLGYTSCEIPANLILKKANPAYWIGSLAIAWGCCSIGMAYVTDFTSLLIVRALLGVSEAGFFPGVVYYLSRWYKPEEQSFRVALFYCSSALAGTVGGLLASAFLQIDEALGLKGWQWLFLVEGAPSILLGIITWYVLPSSPEKFGGFNEQEREMSSARLYHLQQEKQSKIDLSRVLSVLRSPVAWAFSLLFFSIATTSHAKSFYTPAIISAMGYSTTESNLLSALLSFAGFLFILGNGYHSDRVGERPFHVIIPIFVGLLGFASLSVATYFDQPEASYASMFLCAAQSSTLPVLISWLGLSITGSTEFATASALMISIGNLGGIVGPNLYGFLYMEPEEGEEEGSYLLGHVSMVAFLMAAMVISALMRLLIPAKSRKDLERERGERRPLLVERAINDPVSD